MRNRIAVALSVCVLAALALGATASATMSTGNIVQVASGDATFSTLVTLVKDAGLVRALEAKGPYTVFAPTDAAFAKLPKSTVAALEKNTAELKKILLYHVVAGKYTAAQVIKHKTLKTLEGGSLTITTKGAKVFINGVQVITPNVAASNGVIHVIGAVLQPAG